MRKLVAVIVLAAGCGSVTDPPLTGDIYVLDSIEGVALPAPYSPNRDAMQRIIADTLALATDGSGTRRTAYEGGPDPTRPRREETAFSYTRSGDHIEIAFACPPTARCIPAPHLAGTITTTGITITTSVVLRYPLVFHRLFPPD